MSQQLTLSSLFSVLALASLCLAVGGGIAGESRSASPAPIAGLQAEIAPGLPG